MKINCDFFFQISRMSRRSIIQREINDILDSDASDAEPLDAPHIYQQSGDMVEVLDGTPTASASISHVSFYATSTSDTSESTATSPVSVKRRVKAHHLTKKSKTLPQESDDEHDATDPTWHPIASSRSTLTHVKVKGKGKGQSVKVQTFVTPTPSSSKGVSVVTSVPGHPFSATFINVLPTGNQR